MHDAYLLSNFMQCVVGKATSDRKHDSIFYGYCYYTNVFSQNQ